MRIKAEDKGVPPASDTANVVISVKRNLNSPIFTQDSYSATVPADREIDTVVVQLLARDGDQVRISMIEIERYTPRYTPRWGYNV